MNFIYSKHRLFLANNIREQNQDDKKLRVTMTWIAAAKSFEFACVCDPNRKWNCPLTEQYGPVEGILCITEQFNHLINSCSYLADKML